jgi:hypothetical protein
MKPHIVDFFKFLESKNKKKVPLIARHLYPDKFGTLTREDLFIDGDLDLSSTNIKSLPDNLTIEGDLDLSATDIESLPNNLIVVGTLFLSYTPVKFIPNNLKVEGNLYLRLTPLAKRMTEDEIVQEVERKGGYIKDSIIIS